jgi:hypothetical protein
MHHHKVIKTTLCVLEQTFEQIAFFVETDDEGNLGHGLQVSGVNGDLEKWHGLRTHWMLRLCLPKK